MRHAVIGTAGHVDHGKTALVYALTGVQTDRLPEEQRRGITIELGFAPWRLGDDLLVSIIDAPGHRRLVHNMIAGASGIDLVLLVVAADEGVMPQTREHLAACELLGVRHAVVAVTKLDRADAELAELAGEEARVLCGAHGIEACVVACSARTGEGIERLGAVVREAIAARGPTDRARGSRLRLGVDRVFTVRGAGTVVTGTLVEGRLAVGETVRILGAERERSAIARALHVHGESCREALAPTRLAINLAGVDLGAVRRGDVVTSDPAVTPTRMLDVWLQAREPVKRGTSGSIFVGTARSVARIQPLAPSRRDGGELARLRLTAPLVVFGGDRFVLRGAQVDGPAGGVFGGGVVLDARPPRTVRLAKRQKLLESMRRGDGDEAVLQLAHEQAPRVLARSVLPSRLVMPAALLVQAAARQVDGGVLAPAGADGWLWPPALESLRTTALGRVAEHHRKAPLDPGMRARTLREQLASMAGEPAAEVTIEQLVSGPTPALVLCEGLVSLPGFAGAADDPAAAAALARAGAMVASEALNGVSENQLVQQGGVDPKVARPALAALERQGKAVRCGGLWFDATALAELEAAVRAHLSAAERLTIADFKSMTGLGRKQAIPLLEHLDAMRATRRVAGGSDRIAGDVVPRR